MVCTCGLQPNRWYCRTLIAVSLNDGSARTTRRSPW